MARPSALPAVCAPVSGGYVSVAAGVTPIPQAHQVQVQAELAQALPRVTESNGTTGFLGSNAIPTAKKRLMDGARGVPPRGWPV